MSKPTLSSCLVASIAAASAALICLAAPPAEACDRIAEISNVRVGSGPVMVAVYSDEASFMKRPAQAFRIEAQAPVLKVPLCELAAGELAIMVFQDLNANGQMDFNPFGIPNEPFGSSGSAGFGRPNWASARFSSGQTLVRVALSQ